MKRYLFSYGTLRPRHAPAEIAPTVRLLRRVGRGSVRGRLYDLGEYPGAVLSRTGPAIAGQIFELPEDPDVLRRLDEYEGFDPSHTQGSLFVRMKWPVTLQNGKKLSCWVYAYNGSPDRARSITRGDYSKPRKQKRS